jgi:hypothetical protein
VDILINHCLVARGEVVVVEGNYGVRIQQIAGCAVSGKISGRHRQKLEDRFGWPPSVSWAAGHRHFAP